MLQCIWEEDAYSLTHTDNRSFLRKTGAFLMLLDHKKLVHRLADLPPLAKNSWRVFIQIKTTGKNEQRL